MNSIINSKNRIISLDIIRGFALLSILFINIPAFQLVVEGSSAPTNYSGIDEVIRILIDVIITKKFFSIFSFLFGVGFYIFASNAEKRGDNPKRRFARRLGTLFIISLFHIFIFFGSILPAYACIGLLLIPFYHASLSKIAKWLGGIASAYLFCIVIQLVNIKNEMVTSIAISMTTDSTLIFLMFLAGFGVSKAGWIRRIGGFKKQIMRIQLAMLPLVIGGSVWIWLASSANSDQVSLIIKLSSIPTVVLYLSTMFLLLENKTIAKLFTPIASVGKMALTNYVAQSIIAKVIFSFANIEIVSPTQTVWIALLIFTIQIIYTSIWFKFFKMGPLEKMWRTMTYGKKKA
ncbi:DUF418 domain-containing protein [Bacillus bombysepticus]